MAAATQAAWVAALPQSLPLAVCGLHLRGQPLNWQLTDLGSVFVRACKSAPDYKCVRGGRRRAGDSCTRLPCRPALLPQHMLLLLFAVQERARTLAHPC